MVEVEADKLEVMAPKHYRFFILYYLSIIISSYWAFYWTLTCCLKNESKCGRVTHFRSNLHELYLTSVRTITVISRAYLW